MEDLPLFSQENMNLREFDKNNEGKVFEKKILKDGDFNNLEFYNCKFLYCKFNGSTFHKCRFEDCEFTECDLSLIKPRYCAFIDVDFRQSKLVGINWTEAATPLSINFDSCLINLSSFFGLNLTKIKMVECIAKEVDFVEANLANGNFNATDFTNSRFLKTNLTKADFRQAKNYSIDPNNNLLKKTRFSLPEAISLLSGLDVVLD